MQQPGNGQSSTPGNYYGNPDNHGNPGGYGPGPQSGFQPPPQYGQTAAGGPQAGPAGGSQAGPAGGPGQPQYGEPYPGQPQYAYAASNLPPHARELEKLSDDANLWLMIVAAGFWIGFGWIAGPLGWYFGAQIRGKYRAMGHHPCAAANWAWGLGIASTVITGLGVLMVVAVILFMVIGVGAFAVAGV